MSGNNTLKLIDICLDDLGYYELPVEIKIIVVQKIMKDLGMNYKRYYSRRSMRSYKRVKRPDIPANDLIVILTVFSDENHVKYVKYLANKKLDDVLFLYKCYYKECYEHEQIEDELDKLLEELNLGDDMELTFEGDGFDFSAD